MFGSDESNVPPHLRRMTEVHSGNLTKYMHDNYNTHLDVVRTLAPFLQFNRKEHYVTKYDFSAKWNDVIAFQTVKMENFSLNLRSLVGQCLSFAQEEGLIVFPPGNTNRVLWKGNKHFTNSIPPDTNRFVEALHVKSAKKIFVHGGNMYMSPHLGRHVLAASLVRVHFFVK